MPQTSLDFLSPGRPWPPPGEVDRFNRYEENRLLFEGEQAQVYKNWIKLLRDDIKATYELCLNWHKRFSTLWADLLLGEPPKITSKPENAVDKFATPEFRLNAYQTILDVSRYGDGLLKIRKENNKAIIEPNTPQVWIPVVAPDNIKNIKAHILAWVIKRKQEKGPDLAFLRTEIHEPGRITNRLYLLDNDLTATVNGQRFGYKINREVPLNYFPEFAGVKFIEQTGVNDFLVIPIHNLITSDRATGLDDYKDIDGIIQEIMTRFSQIARILDKNADPTVYGPDTMVSVDQGTGQAKFDGLGKYIVMHPEDTNAPGYMEWSGNLESAFKEIETLMEQLYAISETSPAAFGQLKAGLAESGSALRRLMIAPLAKTNRLRLSADQQFKKALAIAATLEGVTIDQITIQWQDGLPLDDTEQAQNHVNKRAAGVISIERALREQGLDGEELKAEMDRLKEEVKEMQVNAPAVNMPQLGGGNGEE